MRGYRHHYSHSTDREVKVSAEPPQDRDPLSSTLLPSGWALGIQLMSDATPVDLPRSLRGSKSLADLPNLFKLWSWPQQTCRNWPQGGSRSRGNL